MNEYNDGYYGPHVEASDLEVVHSCLEQAFKYLERVESKLSAKDALLKVAMEALEFYACDENYSEGMGCERGVSRVQSNSGWCAHEALQKIRGEG